MHSQSLPIDLPLVLEQATELAAQAGQLALQFFRQRLQVEWKADGSPVTAADRAVEAFLRQALQTAFPAHDILGEEGGEQLTGADWLWILDPIDGTRSFARGIPVFGVQMALCYHRVPVLGVIELPALQEQVVAAQGLGCFWNGSRCQVSTQQRPERSLVHVHETHLVRTQAPELATWLDQVQLERNWGDCYSFVLVATGRAEAALDPRMQVWDSAPLPVLLQEAGGVFVDWQGQPTIWTGSVACLNPHFAELLKPYFGP